MKAYEYYAVHCEQMMAAKDDNELTDKIYDLFVAMSGEVKTIIEARHTTREESIVAVIEEQNQKWNAIARIFYKNHEKSPIQQDGFKNLWLVKLPELHSAFRMRCR
jgi:hypothetical protein